mmetsp:Transcript_31286/g.57286  ORF Transcript_31286/g.57286 Transcript_31286/m.57286 type:complete len:125 (+) Transcript_31286:176-550(+)
MVVNSIKEEAAQVPLPPPWNIIIEAVFLPPGLYILLGLVLICALAVAWQFFKDELKPYIYPVLDFLAVIFRSIKACVLGIWWTIKQIAYPLKEGCLSMWDSVDVCCNPYKKRKTTRVDVPTFQF